MDIDIEWLEECIGKDRRAIEKELILFMEQYEDREDPWMKMMNKRIELERDIKTFGYVKV